MTSPDELKPVRCEEPDGSTAEGPVSVEVMPGDAKLPNIGPAMLRALVTNTSAGASNSVAYREATSWIPARMRCTSG